MTEQEWDCCCDPLLMRLELVVRPENERKLLLFALECCFRVKHLLHPESVGLIEKITKVIDEPEMIATAAKNDIEFIQVIGWNQCGDVLPYTEQVDLLREIVGNPFRPVGLQTVKFPCSMPLCNKGIMAGGLAKGKFCPLCGGQGWFNTHKPIVHPSCIQDLAEQCYQGDWDAVGPLSDALEESGYEESHPVLEHLRGKCLRVKGCWAIDLLTGRK